MVFNLPNTITIARIAATPLIATLIICIFYLRMLVVRQAEVQLTKE